MDTLLEELRSLLAPHEQDHVLAFWQDLSAEERAHLAAQIRALDLHELQKLAHGAHAADDWAALRAGPWRRPPFACSTNRG